MISREQVHPSIGKYQQSSVVALRNQIIHLQMLSEAPSPVN
jgi:hypothetical protein